MINRTVFLSLVSAFLLTLSNAHADNQAAVDRPDDMLIPHSSLPTAAKSAASGGLELEIPGEDIARAAASKFLSSERQGDLDKAVNKGKLIADVYDNAPDVDIDEAKSNVSKVWSGLGKLWGGTKQLACGIRDEAVNIGQGVRGGAYSAVSGAKYIWALGRDAYGYVSGMSEDEAYKAQTVSIRSSAGEFLESGSTDIKAALKRTPDAFMEIGKGGAEFGVGAYEVIEAGKPIYDAILEVAPYVATACTIIAAV